VNWNHSCCSICWKFRSGEADAMTFRFLTPFSCLKMQSVNTRRWLTASCRLILMWVMMWINVWWTIQTCDAHMSLIKLVVWMAAISNIVWVLLHRLVEKVLGKVLLLQFFSWDTWEFANFNFGIFKLALVFYDVVWQLPVGVVITVLQVFCWIH